jgi:hypothetical protein
MATTLALADGRLVSLVLSHLSDMTYKDRRQNGPDQPVEFIEFRPTLLPSICVSKLWADAGTSILWKRYPHLPAMQRIPIERRKWYASKVERIYLLSPPSGSGEDLGYLEQLDWPCLKSLELEGDWRDQNRALYHMLHPNLEHLEISATLLDHSTHIAKTLLPKLSTACRSLQSIHIGPDAVNSSPPVQAQIMSEILDANPTVKDVSIMNAGFRGTDILFRWLGQRPGLEALELDLDPGTQLLQFIQDPGLPPNSFSSLLRLHVMCYPEIALALPALLPNVEKLSFDLARMPDHAPVDSDIAFLDKLLYTLTGCQRLKSVKANIGLLSASFPSSETLPILHGASLVAFAAACPDLTDLALLVSKPAAINASCISSTDFQQFCRLVPRLTQLDLEFHPQTTIALEECALNLLGEHCPQLEVLRLKVALQLPSLTTIEDEPKFAYGTEALGAASTQTELTIYEYDVDYVGAEEAAVRTSSPTAPLFPRLNHLALARPQTVLSVAASTYATSISSQSSSITDPSLEEELVRSWAHSLLVHFPRLDILEAWGDWTGQDNDSMNYFLPLEEPLASIWEFLSGVEQDLWDDGQPHTTEGPESWDDDFEPAISVRSSGDWDRASLVNEYPGSAGSGYLETCDEEPEDMITPVDDRNHWFTKAEDAQTTLPVKPHNQDIYALSDRVGDVTLHE